MRSAMGSVCASPDGDPHLDEAAEFLNRPNFFVPETEPANLQITAGDTFHFSSPVPSGCAENDLVRGRFFPTDGDWRKRPSMILLHGWNAELQYQWMFPFWGQLLARAGVNAFMFELPYHSSRKPRSRDAIRNFFSGDLLHVVRATHQALGDTRALAGWLYASGAPNVGVWGVSLGGWLSALAVSHQPEITNAVLLTPVVRMDRAFRDLPFCEPMRCGVNAAEQESFTPLNVISHRPLCDSRNVLVVASRHDLFAPPETLDELEQSWKPEVWRVNHGHITVLLSTRIMRRIVKWAAAHTTTPTRTS